MYGQPVGRQHAESRAEIDRQPIVAGELDATDAYQRIKTTVHGEIATEIALARKEVVAQREAVIREASLISGQKLDVAAERLEAGLASRGLPYIGPEKEVFCHMVVKLRRVIGTGPEVLDGHETQAEPDFPVLVVDLGDLDLAARHVRIDDARRCGIAVCGFSTFWSFERNSAQPLSINIAQAAPVKRSRRLGLSILPTPHCHRGS